MANVSKHKFVSPKSEGTDPTQVGPNEWNSEHAFTGGGDGDLLVRDSTQTDGVNWSSGKVPNLPAGTGILLGTSGVAGTSEAVASLQTSIAGIGTPADTAEHTLFSYSLPAGALSANGKAVRITTQSTVAANGNTKTLRLYFGATVVDSISSSFGGLGSAPVLNSTVIRTGASTQLSARLPQGTVPATPAEATSGAIVIKLTGQNGSASANDILAFMFIVEFLN